MDYPHETPQEPETFSETDTQLLFEQLMDAHQLMGPLSAARYEVVDKLERIEESKLGPVLKEHCSICYDSFEAIIAKEEQFIAMDIPIPESQLGVTKLQNCGHYFCRKDISKWILEGNDLCPYCRAPYLPAGGAAAEGSASDATNTDRRTDLSSFEGIMEHLQSRWDAARADGRGRDAQRPSNGSGMYS